jgi:hypothetical protein
MKSERDKALAKIESMRDYYDCKLNDSDRYSKIESERDKYKEIVEDFVLFIEQYRGLYYHNEGMGCGLEDRGITDRYVACEHGWDKAMERVDECLPAEDVIDSALSLRDKKEE